MYIHLSFEYLCALGISRKQHMGGTDTHITNSHIYDFEFYSWKEGRICEMISGRDDGLLCNFMPYSIQQSCLVFVLCLSLIDEQTS